MRTEAAITSLHSQIDQEFRKAGIEIAFPQRDLHIRTAKGLKEAYRPPLSEENYP